MRQEIDVQLYLNFSEPASLKIAKEYRLKYEEVMWGTFSGADSRLQPKHHAERGKLWGDVNLTY